GAPRAPPTPPMGQRTPYGRQPEEGGGASLSGPVRLSGLDRHSRASVPGTAPLTPVRGVLGGLPWRGGPGGRCSECRPPPPPPRRRTARPPRCATAGVR